MRCQHHILYMWHGKFSAGKNLSCLFNLSTLSYSDNNNSSLINNNINNVVEVTKALMGADVWQFISGNH